MRLLVSFLAVLLLAPLAASAQVIHACVKNGGTLKVVPDPVECGQGDTPLSWNVQGPAGADGADGQDGMDGAPGADAEVLRVFDAAGADIGLFMDFKTAAEVRVFNESLGLILNMLVSDAQLLEPSSGLISFGQAGCMGDPWAPAAGEQGIPGILFSGLEGGADGKRFFYIQREEPPQIVTTFSGNRGGSTCQDTTLTEILVPAVEVPAEDVAFLDNLVGPLYVAPATAP